MIKESSPIGVGVSRESKIQKMYSNTELVEKIMKGSTCLGSEEILQRLKEFTKSLEQGLQEKKDIS